MIRGTTPTIVFNINSELDLSAMVQVWATFKSKTHEVTRDLSTLDIDTDKRTVTVTLTQEETLQFKEINVDAQLRLLSDTGKAYASDIKRLKVGGILRDGVIYEDDEQ